MNNLPEEYVVKVNSDDEFQEVLKSLITTEKRGEIFLTGYKHWADNGEYFLFKDRNDWGYNSTNTRNYIVYTFIEWKDLIEEKDWSGAVVKYKTTDARYYIIAENSTRYRVTWDGNNEGVTYDRKQVNGYIKEGTWVIVETPKQRTNMKQEFSVSGTKILKEAFIKQLELEGFKPYSENTVVDILRIGSIGSVPFGKNIGERISKTYQYDGSCGGLNYNLPEDWEKALQAFKDFYKQEFKIGDIVYVHGKTLDNSYGVKGKIGKITSFNQDKNDDGEYNPIIDSGVGEISVKHIQLANKEQIKEYNKPKEEKVVMLSGTSIFELTVRKGSVYYAPDDYTFTEANMIELKELVENETKVGKYLFKASEFTWGCKNNIPYSSLCTLLKTWDKLNNG